MLKTLSTKRTFYTTRRALIVVACLIAFVSVIFPLALRHSQAAPPSQQDKPKTNSLWQDVAESSIPRGERAIVPGSYRTLQLDLSTLKTVLESAPMEFTKAAKDAPVEITMPMPDGKFSRFKIVESPMMEPNLAAQFPEIKTYSGIGIDDPTATMRFDLTQTGLHAIILSTHGTVLIDPYAKNNTANYISYYKRDYKNEVGSFACFVTDSHDSPARIASPQVVSNAGTLHTYRLALAATGQYTNRFRQAGDTDTDAKLRAFGAMVSTMNRVNAVFGRDLSIRLNLIANELQIIYTNPANDPYDANDSATNNTGAIGAQNQTNLDNPNVVGNENYDIGHVFGSSSGDSNGNAGSVGNVCRADKGGAFTIIGAGVVGDAFDLDYAAHEMGHQFGGSHTFNNNANGACAGTQYFAPAAYEPGSGSTIMSYAGICTPANLQRHSDDYFHVKSLEEIIAYITTGGGSGCATQTPTGNNVTLIAVLSPPIFIPSRTPFRMDAGAFTDPDGDAVTYDWEEYDLGASSPPESDDGSRPIFRSYHPSTNTGRTFPSMQYILNNANNPPATYNCGTVAAPINCITGEALPTTTRAMTFQATLRDNRDGITSLAWQINVRGDSGPFVVTQPNSNISWAQGTQHTVLWNVANTANAPVSCANVRITLSTDGGNTFPIELLVSPNTGSSVITLPEVTTNSARIKVQALDNIFFDISDTDFRIIPPIVSNTNDSGAGSLRQAIVDANASADLTVITFAISGSGVHTINLQSELPVITSPVILDAWTQGGVGYVGVPLIELNGAGAGTSANGLTISGGNSLVRGFIINRFSVSGIDLRTNGDNAIKTCYIGTNAAGTAAQGNGENGVFINNTIHNSVGDITTRTNIISGNKVGVRITGSNATTNFIENNFIGTDVTGTARVSNTLDGINISDGPGNFIGSQVGGPFGIGGGNVISGNNGDGIEISGAGASGTHISNNIIGLNVSGTAALGNFGIGVNITNSPDTSVGFPNPASRNIISGNQSYGVSVTGIAATGTLIRQNYIGTNKDGTAAIKNNVADVYILSANNTIGGTDGFSRNVISAASGNGIALYFEGATGNVVQGNFIGTDASGAAALGHVGIGIATFRANNNIIGGTTPAARNITSGNFTGIDIVDSSNTLIQGNYVGTNAAGSAALNNVRGVLIEGGSGNVIGGTTAGAGNLISGNGSNTGNDHGLILSSSSSNTVQGNFIGTNAAGNAALGNGGHGVALLGSFPSNNNLIGGPTAAARNVISANIGDGVYVAFGNGNVVQGNYIGTDAAGTANLGNGHVGVELPASNNNVIGGTNAGEGNLICFNGVVDFRYGDGVKIYSSTTGATTFGVGNRIRGNSIFSNVRLGIDLVGGTEGIGAAAGVTANDPCDSDIGIGAPNNLQNYPVLTSATSSGAITTVAGILDSTSSTAFTVDFYANAACDASGNGEGQTFLGSTTVTTNGSCNGSFVVVLPFDVPVGGSITATAIDPAGNTSEFSACRLVEQGGPCLSLSRTSQSFTASGGNGSVNVTGSAACAWTAVSNNAAFITVTSGANGNGNGTVNFSVAAHNNTAARSGTITIANQTFTVVQGAAFLDVPVNDPFYTDIGKLSARGITLGCGGGNYCPNDAVTREQMAAFIIRALGEFNPPPPANQRFSDVPPSNPFYSFIDRMAILQITLGCSSNPPQYCPSQPVLREQMAAFIIRALHAPGYNPPPPAQQRFQDVPPSNQFYAFIEEMAVRGVTLGCASNPPRYCPADSVTRAQMAAFLVRAFNL